MNVSAKRWEAMEFQQLLGADDYLKTAAYWLGTCAPNVTPALLEELGAVMGHQYDHEDQADAFGSALPAEQRWVRSFAPVAPVQLASRWTPVARAVSVLGAPTHETLSDGRGARVGAVAWAPAALSTIRSTSRTAAHPDEKRFLGLLTVSLTRAQEKRRGVLLVAKPGWSYESVHEVSKASSQLMADAGFVVTTRRP